MWQVPPTHPIVRDRCARVRQRRAKCVQGKCASKKAAGTGGRHRNREKVREGFGWQEKGMGIWECMEQAGRKWWWWGSPAGREVGMAWQQ